MHNTVIGAFCLFLGILIGIALSRFLGLWKRWSTHNQDLLSRKIAIYNKLIAIIGKTLRNGINVNDPESVLTIYKDDGSDGKAFLENNLLFVGPNVAQLVYDFQDIASNPEFSRAVKTLKLHAVYTKLYKTCSEEIGLLSTSRKLEKKP